MSECFRPNLCVQCVCFVYTFYFLVFFLQWTALPLFSRPVNMAPQMTQQSHSAGQMLAQISRQNGAPQSVTPSSTASSLHGGPTGGWPAPAVGARPQFSNQVTTFNLILFNLNSCFVTNMTLIFLDDPEGSSTSSKDHVSTVCISRRVFF